ncbi:MAG TPA: hypothetical protein VMZ30_06450, partial [Pyrinomonadaceae bacterium]|nr:hypothetical protein [Pyrinomonadaceae bacterium]
MAKEIWLGPLLGNNRGRLIERCSQFVSEGKSDSFLYLAASHPLLEIVTQGLLDGLDNCGVWGELPVYLFRGFVRRVLTTAVDETGHTLAPRIPVDREELPLKRSLVSQILRQLATSGQLTGIKALANREGCVNTVATLVGEIQRAGKTPSDFSEIVARRIADLNQGVQRGTAVQRETDQFHSLYSQIDFDRDVALIYSTYVNILRQNKFTEADADQLRALAILKGDLDGQPVHLPWLQNVQLLILDGFFDFTPVQGEMLRHLIPIIPDVVVNLKSDSRNPAIFEPFSSTIEQLKGIADFKLEPGTDCAAAAGALSDLRENLFRSAETSAPDGVEAQDESGEPQENIRLFTCADRETEIRKIAKEVKRLVVEDGYRIAEIALVVRERASYADTIARVMRDESIPSNLELRVNVTEIPAVRAARKLFEMLEDDARAEKSEVRIADLADLIKSEYFRVADAELAELELAFEQKFGALLTSNETTNGETSSDRRASIKYGLGIGRWDPDSLENTVAFVGGALNMTSWLERARKLLSNWPQVKATTDLVTPETADGGG